MADPRDVGFAKDNSLDDLNLFVRQQEELLGPLVRIGNDGNQTVLTFDMDQARPEKHAVIQEGNPPASGSGIKGKVFVAGQLKDAFATR
jgi:hypothetical protein